MKKQILKLFFIIMIPTKILAQSNHYTDYIYEHYLNGKKIPSYKEKHEENIITEEWVKEKNKLEYYDYLIRTDKEIKENLKVKQILDNDKQKSAEKLKKTKQDLEELNNEDKIIKKKKSVKKDNTKTSKSSGMYMQVGTGLSYMLPYSVSTEDEILQNNKTKTDEYNNNLNIVVGYYMYKKLETELEYSKQSFLNNEVTGINRNKVNSYIQNIKISSLGINVMYPITFPDKKFQLSFGIGGGVATTFISDFGSIYMKGDEIVDKTVEPTATLKKFSSKEEKHNTPFASVKLLSDVLLSKNISFVTSLKYDLLKDIKTEENVLLNNLSAVNLYLGIKCKFN